MENYWRKVMAYMRVKYYNLEYVGDIKKLEYISTQYNEYSFVSTKNEIERPPTPIFPVKEN